MGKRNPVDMSKYPPNWKEISLSIRERAGNKCEWCGIPNHSLIHRLKKDKAMWVMHDEWLRMPLTERLLYGDESKIILTVSHFDHDTTHNDPSNLNALCNRCHLAHDAQFHAQNAKKTRARKRAEAAKEVGQLSLFESEVMTT